MLAAAAARRRLGHDLPVFRRRQHPTRQQRKRPRPDQALGLHHPGRAAGRARGPGAHQHQQVGLRRQHAGLAAEHGPEDAGEQADLMGRGLREVLQGESGAARLGSGEEVAGGDGGLAQRRLNVQRGGLAHRAEQRAQPRGRPERPGGGARPDFFLCLLVRPFTGRSRRRRRRRRHRLVWAGPRLEKHFRGARLSLCLLVRLCTGRSRRRRHPRRRRLVWVGPRLEKHFRGDRLSLCLLVRPCTGRSRRRRRRRRSVWAGPRLEKRFRGAHLSLRLCLLVRPLTRSSRRRRRCRRPVWSGPRLEKHFRGGRRRPHHGRPARRARGHQPALPRRGGGDRRRQTNRLLREGRVPLTERERAVLGHVFARGPGRNHLFGIADVRRHQGRRHPRSHRPHAKVGLGHDHFWIPAAGGGGSRGPLA
mmetsp:Transcript_173233/g.555627  ORF Transcript_173233/g.555627 Transcript_173233/m.555627 type:complete len:420 (+) Transcript_173233:767-2026(+)